jgi:serine/threonine-protein kinase
MPLRLRDWEAVEVLGEGRWTWVFRARPSVGPPPAAEPALKPESAPESALEPYLEPEELALKSGPVIEPPGKAYYALKVPRREWEKDPTVQALFCREALVGSRVSHPHVVPVLAAYVSESPRLLVMPALGGATLRAILTKRVQFQGRMGLDPPDALWFCRQAAEGLDALAQAGWLHGDVKPSNIFVGADGHVTLLDLGFARRLDGEWMEEPRWLRGTPQYLAPEWLTSPARPDVRSDIYSLGVVLYEALSGRLPFEAVDPRGLVRLRQEGGPPPLDSLLPTIPTGVVELVHQMLANDPLRRPQSHREVVERLVGLEIGCFAWRE